MQWAETKRKLRVNGEHYRFWAQELCCHSWLINACHSKLHRALQKLIKNELRVAQEGNQCFRCLLIGNKHTLAGSSPASCLIKTCTALIPRGVVLNCFRSFLPWWLWLWRGLSLSVALNYHFSQGAGQNCLLGECFWGVGAVLSHAGKAKQAHRQRP